MAFVNIVRVKSRSKNRSVLHAKIDITVLRHLFIAPLKVKPYGDLENVRNTRSDR